MATVTFYGHSCFSLSDRTHTLLFDPFITGNPQATLPASDIHADYILLTHGHSDHIGDAVPMAKQRNATIIASFELAKYCERQGAKVHDMGIGGSYKFPFGRVKLTQATHGSAIITDDGIEYLGNPCGILVRFNGRTYYNTGDTGLFGDMALIGKLYKPEIVILPIGDNYTMGIEDAVEAIKMIKPKIVIPVHYNTFPVIMQDPYVFVKKVGKLARCVVLKPGDTYEIS
ncbi:MAG TPA: metal-dependent hydrolase [Candidatus Latescibacteria bacterium]|jgi:L-ascorbate metabolism protein UlaG (beta-lactamase superfamily)|nr:metal-dependent hydrolase [Candidatus Latescibacterota bacterium]